MTNPQRDAKEATAALQAAKYVVVPYPQIDPADSLIIRRFGRTVTTLKVLNGTVDADSVAYLLDEAKRFLEDGHE